LKTSAKVPGPRSCTSSRRRGMTRACACSPASACNGRHMTAPTTARRPPDGPLQWVRNRSAGMRRERGPRLSDDGSRSWCTRVREHPAAEYQPVRNAIGGVPLPATAFRLRAASRQPWPHPRFESRNGPRAFPNLCPLERPIKKGAARRELHEGAARHAASGSGDTDGSRGRRWSLRSSTTPPRTHVHLSSGTREHSPGSR
jgi:hypothetical protein